ncbi:MULTISPECIES: fluoride efflux transporter FluC [unclassified Nocardiopsis]|uniref:fluoride efflux transporter FluC n=1 Tax=Nocardiopsis TaxID=2013 RepID=UPI00387B0C39
MTRTPPASAGDQHAPERGRPEGHGERTGPVSGPGPRILGFALLVAAGSTVGTFVRAGLGTAFPAAEGQWPWATFGINVLGSLLLGVLLEALSRAGEDTGWRRRVRLAAGTGVLGGFTTYSTYVLEIDRLAGAGHLPVAAAYALVSVIAGVAAAGLGVAAVAAVARRAGRGHR